MIDEEKDRVVLTPLDAGGGSESTSMDLVDLIPGLTEKTVYLDIRAKALAGFLVGYQMHYNAKCKFESDDGELKESTVVLNWSHSGIKKPDVFKTVICGDTIKEGGLWSPLDIKNTFKKEAGKKAYILTTYFDSEQGKNYKMQTLYYAPDGKIYKIGAMGGNLHFTALLPGLKIEAGFFIGERFWVPLPLVAGEDLQSFSPHLLYPLKGQVQATAYRLMGS